MALEDFEKQPYEKFFIAGDYSDVLETGETLVLGSCTATAVDADGTDATATVLESGSLALDQADTYLKVRVQAGAETGSPYKITLRGLTSDGNQWEIDVKMKVKEL